MKKIKGILYFLFFPLLAFANGEGPVWLLFTHNGNGNLASCDCPSHPYGGMTRRATYIKEFRKTHEAMILVSTGDEVGLIQEPIRDRYILQALRLMNYDLVVPGDQELVYPVDFFLAQGSPASSTLLKRPVRLTDVFFSPGKGLNFLCCNLYRTNDPKPFFLPYVILEKNGIKILFIGVVGKDIEPFIQSADIRWKDYHEAVKSILSKWALAADLVVLLSHSGIEEDKRIAREIKGIHLIIGGHTQNLLLKPLEVSGVKIVQAGNDCQYIGKLEISKDKKVKLGPYEIIPLKQDVKESPEIKALLKKADEEFRKKAKSLLLEKD